MKRRVRLILTMIFLSLMVFGWFLGEKPAVFSLENPPPGCKWFSFSAGRCPPGYPINCPNSTFCCENLDQCSAVTQNVTPRATIPANPTLSLRGDCKENEIDTALGCIPIESGEMFPWIIQLAIGISGGIAFLLMLFGGLKILVSAGDPKGIQAGKESITSALLGLLIIVFSVFLLELIGVKILKLPGL